MLAQRSDSSLGVRTVECLRDNGARGLVTKVESIYYSLTAGSTGGPGLRSLPRQPGSVSGLTAAGPPPAPARYAGDGRHDQPAELHARAPMTSLLHLSTR
jgi:hypothetical protein